LVLHERIPPRNKTEISFCETIEPPAMIGAIIPNIKNECNSLTMIDKQKINNEQKAHFFIVKKNKYFIISWG
jgi:hypothetical protein